MSATAGSRRKEGMLWVTAVTYVSARRLLDETIELTAECIADIVYNE
jgi:hypothetical protein